MKGTRTMLAPITISPKEAERFWSKVDRSGGPDVCWSWTGSKKSAGYGNFFVRRDPPGGHGRSIFMNAHRAAYTLANGPVPDDLVVRHTCDNPPCCNPAHLLIGTMADNVQDAIDRGLWDPKEGAQKTLPYLIAHNTARRHFTEEDIALFIVARASGQSIRSIASIYGSQEGTISGVFRGHAYKDIPLVQRLATLYHQGIRFPYYRGKHTPDTIHPALRAIADDAARLVRRMLEAVEQQEREQKARQVKALATLLAQEGDREEMEFYPPAIRRATLAECEAMADEAASRLQAEDRRRAYAEMSELFV